MSTNSSSASQTFKLGLHSLFQSFVEWNADSWMRKLSHIKLLCYFKVFSKFKTTVIYPNLNFGQYLTVRVCFCPVFIVTLGAWGFGRIWVLSCSLSVIVKPCSSFMCRFILGRKCVDTCWDFTLGLEPILAFPLLLRATNHSLPVRWFLCITDAYVL